MNNILIVVDVQEGFKRHEQTISCSNKIKLLLQKKVFDSVIATRFINYDNSVYENLLSWNKLKDEPEYRISEELRDYVDLVYDKCIYNCVSADFLQKLCQCNDGIMPTKIYLCGMDTDCCVLTISTALFENNIRPIVLTKYCSSNGGLESHKSGLVCLRRIIGKKQLLEKNIESKNDLIC